MQEMHLNRFSLMKNDPIKNTYILFLKPLIYCIKNYCYYSGYSMIRFYAWKLNFRINDLFQCNALWLRLPRDRRFCFIGHRSLSISCLDSGVCHITSTVEYVTLPWQWSMSHWRRSRTRGPRAGRWGAGGRRRAEPRAPQSWRPSRWGCQNPFRS